MKEVKCINIIDQIWAVNDIFWTLTSLHFWSLSRCQECICVSRVTFFEYFKHCMFLGIHPCTFLSFILHSIFSLNSCRDFSLKFLLKAACLLKVLFLKLLLSYFLWCNASNTANNWRHAHPSLSSRFSVRSQGFNCAMKKVADLLWLCGRNV